MVTKFYFYPVPALWAHDFMHGSFVSSYWNYHEQICLIQTISRSEPEDSQDDLEYGLNGRSDSGTL